MDQEANNRENQKPADNEIDLLILVQYLWVKRRRVLKTTVIFICIGLFFAVLLPKEYKASTTIVPATQGKNVGGNLGGLAAMAGINLGGMSSESGISPALYPQIIGSVPFQKELLKTLLNFEGQKLPITYEDYYTNYKSLSLFGILKKYTIGLPGALIKRIKGEPVSLNGAQRTNLLTITYREQELIDQLLEQLSLEVNKKEGYVTLSVNMPEPLAAAELAQKAQELLQQYIINFKIKKSSEQLKFIKERYVEKEKEFKRAQQQLANFQDQNQFVNSALAKMSLMPLQTDYDLTYGVYLEMAKQLETQQIQVKEDTPVFTIIKPISVPLKKSKPNRPMILILWTFLGVITGIGLVLCRKFLKLLKEKLDISKEVL